jgi:H+/Cl- antiporter ClcA
MTEQNDLNATQESWKSRTYFMGLGLGAFAGLFAAYVFVRSAEENPDTGKPEPMSTGTLISILLATVTLIRQIADSGKPKKK